KAGAVKCGLSRSTNFNNDVCKVVFPVRVAPKINVCPAILSPIFIFFGVGKVEVEMKQGFGNRLYGH
ncbi:hypothetical protein, partial [Kingella kingae]|uniref:hypothetical protein n=1 Tax=Kingella kingae TaxID=504 RepID=UPI001E3E260D